MNSSIQKPDQIAEIDALKAIAIIGVVFGHISFSDRFPESALSIIEWLQLFLTSWAPLAFFWASGFLGEQSVQRRERAWKTHLKEKVRRLLVPFVVFSVFYSVILFALSKTSLIDRQQLPWTNFGGSIHDWIQLIPGAGHYFFIHLFVISLLIDSFLLKHSPLIRPFILTAMIIVVLALWGDLPQTPHGPWLEFLGVHMLAYVFGVQAGRAKSIKSREFVSCLGVIGALAIVGLFLESPPFYWLIIPPLIFGLLKFIPKLTAILQSARLGRNAAAVFVWHSPLVMAAVSMAMVKITSVPVLIVFGTAVITIGACIALNSITAKFKGLRWFAV